ncbi:hypothetical protein HYFRA_00008383 [Hymenoscyphus fraxineus]|uniref:Uncharacterized protein n=1 Tax=Hymenoscyphus fraxineus TaxID=746836 RepID=A0A9N9KNE8_9HELO|nr:hypothetical protein HYFRA_00008383 [Hymenoscyphus fraxineus]
MKIFMLLVAITGFFNLVIATPAIAPVKERDLSHIFCCNEIAQGWIYTLPNLIPTTAYDITPVKYYPFLKSDCVQLACRERAEVVLCNELPGPRYIPVEMVAQYARDIINKCTTKVDNVDKVCGQAFDIEKVNVIVKEIKEGVACTAPWPPVS